MSYHPSAPIVSPFTVPVTNFILLSLFFLFFQKLWRNRKFSVNFDFCDSFWCKILLYLGTLKMFSPFHCFLCYPLSPYRVPLSKITVSRLSSPLLLEPYFVLSSSSIHLYQFRRNNWQILLEILCGAHFYTFTFCFVSSMARKYDIASVRPLRWPHSFTLVKQNMLQSCSRRGNTQTPHAR